MLKHFRKTINNERGFWPLLMAIAKMIGTAVVSKMASGEKGGGEPIKAGQTTGKIDESGKNALMNAIFSSLTKGGGKTTSAGGGGVSSAGLPLSTGDTGLKYDWSGGVGTTPATQAQIPSQYQQFMQNIQTMQRPRGQFDLAQYQIPAFRQTQPQQPMQQPPIDLGRIPVTAPSIPSQVPMAQPQPQSSFTPPPTTQPVRIPPGFFAGAREEALGMPSSYGEIPKERTGRQTAYALGTLIPSVIRQRLSLPSSADAATRQQGLESGKQLTILREKAIKEKGKPSPKSLLQMAQTEAYRRMGGGIMGQVAMVSKEGQTKYLDEVNKLYKEYLKKFGVSELGNSGIEETPAEELSYADMSW